MLDVAYTYEKEEDRSGYFNNLFYTVDAGCLWWPLYLLRLRKTRCICHFADLGGGPIFLLVDLWSYEIDDLLMEILMFGPLMLSPVFSAAVLSTIAYSVIMAPVVSVSTLFLAFFGWIGPGLALFGDLAVEPTPEGPVTLIHIDWKAQHAESIFALNHSRTYANPDALRYITKWIGDHL